MKIHHAVPMLFLVLAALPAVARADLSAKTLSKQVGLDQRLDSQVPLDLEFRDEQGQPVQLRQFFNGKPVILSLVQFRCPMLCTQVLNGVLKTSQAVEFQMHRDYEVLSISIDPRETAAMAAAKKHRYASSYHRPGAEEGWHFLTGEQDTIDRLAAAVGYRYVYDEKSDQFAHPSGIIVLTPDGRVSRYFYGIDFHPSDLRLGLVESSEGKIGTPVDQILLLCFHYDPATGKYGFAIAAVMRVVGIATMLGLGSFLALMIRREYQRSHVAQSSAASVPSQPR